MAGEAKASSIRQIGRARSLSEKGRAEMFCVKFDGEMVDAKRRKFVGDR
jgi:hypothetical protein